jgi:hypothetical protein
MAYAECFKELGQKDKDMIMNKAIGRLKKVDF